MAWSIVSEMSSISLPGLFQIKSATLCLIAVTLAPSADVPACRVSEQVPRQPWIKSSMRGLVPGHDLTMEYSVFRRLCSVHGRIPRPVERACAALRSIRVCETVRRRGVQVPEQPVRDVGSRRIALILRERSCGNPNKPGSR